MTREFCRASWLDNTATNVWLLQYDPVNQLLAVTVRGNTIAGAILKQYAYGYDLAGNRTSEQIGNGTGASPVAISQSSYNSANQLTTRTGGSGQMQFAGSLDEPGTVNVATNAAVMNNLTTNFVGYASVTNGTNVIPITATDYSYNSRTNKYQVIVTNTVGSQTLAFDLNGNMTNDGGGISYEYDAANHTVAINRGTTNRTEFAYDGAGRRVQVIEKTNGVAYVTNKYVWCGTELCEQRDMTGGTVTKRFFGDGEQINGTNYYFTGDHLGSIREMVDSAGVIQARYDYDPYGRRTKVSGSMDADFGFTGHFMLVSQPETTLTLFRLYRADLGRWLSRDPLAEQAGLNLYAYVDNNPINGTDPLGLYGSSINTPMGLAVMAWAANEATDIAVNVAKEVGTQLGSGCFNASNLASAASHGATDHAIGNAVAAMLGLGIGRAIDAAIGLVARTVLSTTTKALAPIEKFSEYLFKEGATHGKDAIYRSFGYGIENSAQLAKLFESQAATKYAQGQYTLGRLDQHGQRIDIIIDLPGIGNAVGKTGKIVTGWMIRANGTITLNTPLGG